MGSSISMGNGPTSRLWELITRNTDHGGETQGVEGSKGTGEPVEILSGENVEFSESVSDNVEVALKVMPLEAPDVNVIGDDSDVAEQILANLKDMNKNLNKSIAEVKKHSGMAKAMLKASGIDLGPISKVFFDIFALMALMIETAQRQRDAGREMRQASLSAMVASLEKQADKQLEAATDRRNAALVSAGFAIGMGVLSMGMAGLSGAKGMEAQKIEFEADKLDDIADPVLDAAQTGVPNTVEKVQVQVGGNGVQQLPQNNIPEPKNNIPEPQNNIPEPQNNIQPEPQKNQNNGVNGNEGNNNDPKLQKNQNDEINGNEGNNNDPKLQKNQNDEINGKNGNDGEAKIDEGKQPPTQQEINSAKEKISNWEKTWDGKTKPPKDVADAARTLKRGAKGMHMEAKALEIKQTRIKQFGDAMMNISKGIGDIFAAQVNLNAEMAQVEATREQINQKTAESSMQDATEAMQAAQELINTVIRAVMQIKAAEIEMMKTASFA